MTPTEQLIDIKLDGRLKQVIAESRAAGKSWTIIARDIFIATGVSVSNESLRQWFAPGGRWTDQGEYFERES